MANNWQLGMLAGLDSQSRNQLNQDIKAIQKTLNSVELKATLNPNQIKSLENQLSKLQVSLTDVNIPKSVLDGLVSQINNALSGIQIPNISLGGQTANQARQAGQQIGNIVSQEVANSLDKITSKEIGVAFKVEETDSDEFNRAVDEEIKKLQQAKNKLTSVRYTTNTEQRPIVDIFGNVTDEYEHVEKLTGAVFRYNTETGEAITKTMKWAQIGTTVDDNGDDIPLMGWVQGLTTYNKSLEEATVKTDNFVDKQQKAVAAARNTLSQIESDLNDANATKSLANTDKLANGLTQQLAQVENRIWELEHATSDTFTQAKIDVDAEIVSLKNLISTLKNAQYVATSLRSKTFDTVKIDEQNKLTPIFDKISKSSYQDSKGEFFSNRITTLKSELDNATDAQGIINYLNHLSNLQTEFDAVVKSANETAKATGIVARASEEISKLNMFESANPDVKDFSTKIGDATLTVKSLLEALKNVDTQPQLTSIIKQIHAFQSAAEEAGKATKSTATEYETLLKKANEAINTNKYVGSTSKIKDDFGKLDDSLVNKSLKADYEELIDLSTKLNSSMSNDNKVKTYSRLEELLPSVKNRITELSSAQKNLDKLHEIQHSTDISDLETKYKKFGMVSEEVENNLKELKSAQEAVFKSQGTDGLGTALENYKTKLAETKASVKELTTTQVSMSQRVSQMTEMQDWMRKNKAATELCGDKIDELIQKCRTCDAVEFNNIKSEFKELKVAAGEAGQLGNTFLGSIKEQASKFVQWFSITSVVMEGVQAIKKMTQEVIAVDSAMIELTKVSNASSNELKNYFDEAAESAKDLGATVSDIINATADWSRLGYSLPDSKKLAEIATLYKNVGDGIDIDTANQSLVSTLQGFKLDTEDAMHIIDSFNEVANNYAIDSAGIGEALQRSASSMYAAGNTLEETIGLVTAANAVVQDPDSIGTAYKTISMRIRGAKTEMEQLGLETDGMVESTATLQKEILVLTGVDIMKDKNTFKSTYAILDELATKWSDLTDIQQASVTELIAGKRQGNIVSALMTNFETAREATQTAVESQGSALREQENYEKGIQYSLDRLSASWQEFSNHFLDSSFIKGIVDFGNTTINVIDDVTSALGSLGTIGVIGGGILGAKNAGKCRMSVRISNCFEYALHA